MIKQVIVIRKDLSMRRGKEIAQGAHASMKWMADKIRSSLACTGQIYHPHGEDHTIHLSPEEIEWLSGAFTKICLRVQSEADLIVLWNRARDAKLTACLIQDAGKTEFGGVPTLTALAIGPNEAEAIDRITGHLQLY